MKRIFSILLCICMLIGMMSVPATAASKSLPDEIKAIADYITDSVENDGFIKAVDKFVWEKKNV